jgi:hypothetical protein
MIEDWRRRLRTSQRAHYEAAKYYERLHWYLSIPTVVVSAILGTTVFTNLAKLEDVWARVTLAVLSVAVVALTSLQGALRFGERSERHKVAAGQVGEVRRELEQQLAFGRRDEAAIGELRKRWNEADRQAPTIPSRIYEKAEEHVLQDEEHEKREEASGAGGGQAT